MVRDRVHNNQRVSSALDAGTTLLGINVTEVARWIGPAVLTIWAVAHALSYGETEAAIPMGVSPLQLIRLLLDWASFSTASVDSLATWIATREIGVGLLGVLGACVGISRRHNIGVVLPLLVAVEAIGAVSTYLSLIALTATLAVFAALFTEVRLSHSGRLNLLDRAGEAATHWFEAVVVSVVLLPVFVVLGVARALMDRYVSGHDDPYTSADQLNDELARQIPDPSMKLSDLKASQALRALAIVHAATRDEDRASEIVRYAHQLRRKDPTGAIDLPSFIRRYRDSEG